MADEKDKKQSAEASKPDEKAAPVEATGKPAGTDKPKPAEATAKPAEATAKPAEPAAKPAEPAAKPGAPGGGPAAAAQARGRGGAQQRGRGRFGGGGPRGRGRGGRDRDDPDNQLEERVVKINRCATVVKGGRRFSFSALVIVGDRKGKVGVGFGKANEVPPTVEKAVKDAKKNFFNVPVVDGTIPHEVIGRFRGSRVIFLPASKGTGVIAGSTVRAVVECAGIQNILTKSQGSNNPINLAKAAAEALRSLRSREEIMRLRGVNL